jgi:hypothetical protein
MPELAHAKKHVSSDNWRRKPMIITLVQWLAKVDGKSKAKTVSSFSTVRLLCGFLFLGVVFLTFSRISQAIDVLAVSWTVCENCLSVFCEFFHSMIPAVQQWEPRVFHGASGVATAFFGYFFWLQKKSASPVVREP